MQAELEKVSSLLDAAAKSFRANEDGCTQLSEAAAILEKVLATQSQTAVLELPRSRSAAA